MSRGDTSGGPRDPACAVTSPSGRDALSGGAAAPGFGWSLKSILALLLLTLAAMYNHLDRALLGYVLPLVKAEMELSDTALGLLSGIAFTLLYSVLAIPMAWLADRTSRRNVIAAGFAFWSAMTFFTAFVTNVWQLATFRLLMGAGEATSLGPSKSITADMFNRTHRPVAMSIIAAGSTFSGILFVPIAGFIAHEQGWRAAFLAAGLSGFIVAVLIFALVREPVAGGSEPEPVSAGVVSIRETLLHLWRSGTYVAMAIAGALMATFVYINAAWEATYLVRVHDYNVAEAAVLLGPVRGATGILGLAIGGLFARRWASSESRRSTLGIVAALGLAVTETIFLLAPSTWMWMTALVVGGIFFTIHIGVIYNLLAILVKPRMRGVAVSLFMLIGTLFGQSIGPALVGAATDLLGPTLGQQSIRYSLLLGPLCALVAAFFFWLGSRRVDAELAAARAADRPSA